MSEPLTVKTSFTNISELAQGYINRVDSDQIILPAPAPVAEGEWLQFIVILEDGTPAFAGVGRCIKVADRGQRAPEELRYELMLDSLGFEEDSRAVFEHMVIVRNAMLGSRQDAPRPRSQPEAAASVQPEAAAAAQPEAAEYEEPEAAAEAEPETAAPDTEDEELQQLDAETRQESEPPGQWPEPEQEAAPSELQPEELATEEFEEPATSERDVAVVSAQPPPGTILTRRVIAGSWQPQPVAAVESYSSSGLFQYPTDALPIPARPPRPDLDPSLWIKPAPRARDAAQPSQPATASRPPVPSSRPAPASRPPVPDSRGGDTTDAEEIDLAAAEEAEPFPVEELGSGELTEEAAGEIDAAKTAEREQVEEVDRTFSQTEEEGEPADPSGDPDRD